jgi:hypothetical protein
MAQATASLAAKLRFRHQVPLPASSRRTAGDSMASGMGEDSPFWAWAGAGVPAVVFVATLSARRRVFAGVAGSAADVAVRFAVFWRHPLVAARVWRVPALAAAGWPGVPAVAWRAADPALAGAWRPIGHSSTVEQRTALEAGPRWDVRPMEKADDWLAVARC